MQRAGGGRADKRCPEGCDNNTAQYANTTSGLGRKTRDGGRVDGRGVEKGHRGADGHMKQAQAANSTSKFSSQYSPTNWSFSATDWSLTQTYQNGHATHAVHDMHALVAAPFSHAAKCRRAPFGFEFPLQRDIRQLTAMAALRAPGPRSCRAVTPAYALLPPPSLSPPIPPTAPGPPRP